jgi:hypothetical protein
MSDRSLVNILSRSDLKDEALPFDRSNFDDPDQPGRQAASTQEITNFLQRQSYFLPVYFRRGVFSRRLSVSASIPIPGLVRIAGGATGEVFEA